MVSTSVTALIEFESSDRLHAARRGDVTIDRDGKGESLPHCEPMVSADRWQPSIISISDSISHNSTDTLNDV
jgi:hypothetical protein